MPAPIGNQNAAKAKVWSAAIARALEKRSKLEQKDALDDLAEKLLGLCDQGDLGALKELGDRLEGKAAQAIGLGQDPNAGPVRTFHELVLVDGRTDAAP
jgi:hypothetical protein